MKLEVSQRAREAAARLKKVLPLLEGLEVGQDCEEYAYANGKLFQSMTHCPEAFEALRGIPEAIECLLASQPLADRVARDRAVLKQIDNEVSHAFLGDTNIALHSIRRIVANALKEQTDEPTDKQDAAVEAAAELERLERQVRYFLPYARWTISDESPGHHPTMPSAVADLAIAQREAAQTLAALQPREPGSEYRRGLEDAAKVAEGTAAFDDALQKSGGGSTTGQRIATAIRALTGEKP